MNAPFALTGDPELDVTVPSHPRALAEVVWIPLSRTRVLAAGSLDVVVLPSRVGDTALLDLLRLLDGSCTLHQLASGSDAPAQERKRLLRLLHRAGLLEQGTVPIEAGTPFTALAMDQTRLHRDRAHAQAHAERSILVAGPWGPLLDAMLGAGLTLARPGEGKDHAFQLLLLNTDGLPLTNGACEATLPTLPIRFHANSVDIGPWLPSGAAGLAALQAHIAAERSITAPDPACTHLLEAFCAHTMLLLVSANAPIVIASTLQRIVMEEDGPQVQRIPVSALANRLPASAGPLQDRLNARAESAMPALRHVGSKAHEAHHSPRNLLAALEVQEPATAPIRSVPGCDNGTSRRVLAVLSMAFGYTRSAAGIRRRSPSGGNLGSPEVLLWSRSNGILHVFRFLPMEATLDAVLPPTPTPAATPGLGVLCIGNREKMNRKYGRFGETLVRLDGGVGKAFFLAAARAQSIDTTALACPAAVPAAVLSLLATRAYHYVPLWACILKPASPWRAGMALARRAASTHEALLDRRRSVRVFDGPGIDAAAFADLVHTAWPGKQASSALVPVLRVRDPTSSAQSFLLLHPDGRTQPLAKLAHVPELFLQRSLDAAPYALFLISDLSSALAQGDTDALDALLLDAGVWLGRLWLALSTQALGGCPCGAAVESDLQATLPAPFSTHSLLASFVAGRPAP